MPLIGLILAEPRQPYSAVSIRPFAVRHLTNLKTRLAAVAVIDLRKLNCSYRLNPLPEAVSNLHEAHMWFLLETTASIGQLKGPREITAVLRQRHDGCHEGTALLRLTDSNVGYVGQTRAYFHDFEQASV